MISLLIAASILVVQADDSPFGRKYFSGFSSVATEKVTAVRYEGKNPQALINRVQKESPDLIFSIGNVPLKELVKQMPSTPLIATDAYAKSDIKSGNVIFFDSDLPISAGLQLATFLFPAKKTIGTIYNPEYSQHRFDELVAQGAKSGLRVASVKVDSASDVKEFIQAFASKIDLFYWIRDPTTADATAVKEIFSFADGNNIPVISLDSNHIEKGALVTVSVSPFELGEQAWKLAQTILKNNKFPQKVQKPDAKELVTAISLKAASRFGIGSEALFTFLQKASTAGFRIRVEP